VKQYLEIFLGILTAMGGFIEIGEALISSPIIPIASVSMIRLLRLPLIMPSCQTLWLNRYASRLGIEKAIIQCARLPERRQAGERFRRPDMGIVSPAGREVIPFATDALNGDSAAGDQLEDKHGHCDH
jgi:hypothetical protein